jgi:hypothetical protein
VSSRSTPSSRWITPALPLSILFTLAHRQRARSRRFIAMLGRPRAAAGGVPACQRPSSRVTATLGFSIRTRKCIAQAPSPRPAPSQGPSRFDATPRGAPSPEEIAGSEHVNGASRLHLRRPREDQRRARHGPNPFDHRITGRIRTRGRCGRSCRDRDPSESGRS